MEAQLRKELEEFRQLHQQAVLDAQQATELAKIAAEETKKAHDQLNLAQQQIDLEKDKYAALELRRAPVTSFHTPVPQTNLSNQIQATVYIDEHTMNTRLHDSLTDLSREFDGRLNEMHQILTNDAVARDDRMLRNVTALLTSSLGRNTSPNVTTGPPGPQNLSSNLAASTVSPSLNLAASTAANLQLPANDYDKAVEVEQRKLINPDTTPTSIRLWLILYDTYSKHPSRLLSMTEAFGEKSLMNLRLMFPDDHIPDDDP